MPNEIKELTQTLLHNPVIIEVTPPSSTVENIKQLLYYVDKANKKNLLVDLLKKEKIESALVFTRTKNNANRLGKFLDAAHIKVGIIHGNKSQSARQIALSKFKNGEIKVLVATDIAARGIDINELSYVFNYDIPTEAEAYVHRIGRTGRAGNAGTSVSFADIDELDLVKSIQKLIHLTIPVVKEHPYPMLVTEPTPKKKQRNSSAKVKNAKSINNKGNKENRISKNNKTEKTSNKKSKDKKSEYKPYQKKKAAKSSEKSYTGKSKTSQQRKPKQGSRGK
ncbi:MAG: helicase-related protein [Anaerorhabdus sp.]